MTFARLRHALACTVFVTAVAIPALAAPPAEGEISAKMEALYDYWRANYKEDGFEDALKKKAAELLADVDITSCSVAQIGEMQGLLGQSPDHMEHARARLATLAAEPTEDGAEAAVAVLMMPSEGADDAMKAGLERAFNHPSLMKLVKGENGPMVFQAIGGASPEMLEPHAKHVLAIAGLIGDDTSPMMLSSATGLALKMNDIKSIDAPTRQRFRQRLIGLMKTAATKEEVDERMSSRLDRQVQFLGGAFARGELMEHVAPPLTVSWSDASGDPITSLSALAGKVVVLDFWATWCGPCIASFPNMRELQERYAGYDVVVIGVTSVQGTHYPGEGAEKIDCEGDPEREKALMAEFMKARDMTWRVAFTDEDVFNADYGVRGIPHVAIVDPAGKVRYNGLHPMAPKAEKCGKIDGLLKEAGLPAPAPVIDEPEKAAG